MCVCVRDHVGYGNPAAVAAVAAGGAVATTATRGHHRDADSSDGGGDRISPSERIGEEGAASSLRSERGQAADVTVA